MDYIQDIQYLLLVLKTKPNALFLSKYFKHNKSYASIDVDNCWQSFDLCVCSFRSVGLVQRFKMN